VFLYLTQTEAKYELTADPAIKMLIVSGAYVMSIYIGSDVIVQQNLAGRGHSKQDVNNAFDATCATLSGKMSFSPINPAIATGLTTADLLSGHFQSHVGFLFCIFPYAGAVLGVILYEFLYKRTVDAVAEENEHSDFSGEEDDKEAYETY